MMSCHMMIFATIVLLHLLNIVTPLPVDKDGQQKQHFSYRDNGVNQAGNAIKAENALHGNDSSSEHYAGNRNISSSVSLLSKHVRVARGTHGCVKDVNRVVVTCGEKSITTVTCKKRNHACNDSRWPAPLCQPIKEWCADTDQFLVTDCECKP